MMRGGESQSGALFSHVGLEAQVPATHPATEQLA